LTALAAPLSFAESREKPPLLASIIFHLQPSKTQLPCHLLFSIGILLDFQLVHCVWPFPPSAQLSLIQIGVSECAFSLPVRQSGGTSAANHAMTTSEGHPFGNVCGQFHPLNFVVPHWSA